VTDSREAWEARQQVRPGASEATQWMQDLQQADHTRLNRVQASARVWLGLLTTLLTLLGSVVLFKGGSLVTGVTANSGFQWALVVLVGLVFAFAILAVIFGGQATWGGLGDLTKPADSPQNRDARSSWRRRWFSFAKLLASTSRHPEVPRSQKAEDQKDRWEVYRDRSLESADRRRIYLHASRATGVIAAGLIALLAILAVIAGTVSPPPSDVIVIHNGHVTCGPVSDSAKDTRVTQVIPVTSC
jgi:fatty acid desaturase